MDGEFTSVTAVAWGRQPRKWEGRAEACKLTEQKTIIVRFLSICLLTWQIFVPRADTVSRLKLNKTDFENHILRQKGGDKSTSLISTNGKVMPASVCVGGLCAVAVFK